MPSQMPRATLAISIGERLRGNGNRGRGSRPERIREGNLPLRGSLRGKSAWEGFQRFSEVLRNFQRFSEALAEPLSECHLPLRVAAPVAPNRVARQNSRKSVPARCRRSANFPVT